MKLGACSAYPASIHQAGGMSLQGQLTLRRPRWGISLQSLQVCGIHDFEGAAASFVTTHECHSVHRFCDNTSQQCTYKLPPPPAPSPPPPHHAHIAC